MDDHRTAQDLMAAIERGYKPRMRPTWQAMADETLDEHDEAMRRLAEL